MSERASDEAGLARRIWIRAAFAILLSLAMGAVWRWTPLSRWLEAGRLHGLLEAFRGDPLAPLWVVAGYAVGGLLFMPVIPAIIATAVVFDPITAIGSSLAGLVADATLCYAVGRILGGDLILRLSHGRVARFRGWLLRKGILPVVLLRNVPVLHFSLTSMAAGAFGLRLRDYLLGTTLGVLPAVLAASLLKDRIRALLRAPPGERLEVLVSLLAAAAVVGLVVYWIRRRVKRRIDAVSPVQNDR